MASTGTTPDLFRGLIVPDPRYAYDADNVGATTQAGPVPGVPAAQQDTQMVLEAVGSQGAGTQLRVRTVRGGHPGVDGARFVWRYETDGANDWRGCDVPVGITGFDFVDRSTTADRWVAPHAITLADGTVVVVVTKALRYVTVWTQDPDTGTWTENTVYDYGSTLSAPMYPTIVELPSGRLVVIHWWKDPNVSAYRVWMHYSDDSGATWDTGQKGCLDEEIQSTSYDLGRLRAAYLDGSIVLLAHLVDTGTPADEIRQYASSDDGANFSLISTLSGQSYGFPDVVRVGGRLLVGYVTVSPTYTATYIACVRALGSAYDDLSSASEVTVSASTDPMEWASVSASVYSDGDLTLWADEDGVVWIAGRDVGDVDDVMVRFSLDSGDSWDEPGIGPASAFGTSTWRGSDTSTYPRALSATASRGRAILAHTHAANPGTGDDSLSVAYLGGYSSVTMPNLYGDGPKIINATGWTTTWLPYDMPEDVSTTWTATAATGASALASGGLSSITGAGQQNDWSASPTSTLAQGLAVMAELTVSTGTAYLKVILSDATPKYYEVHVLVSTSAITLYDARAAANIDSVTTTDALDGYVQVLVEVNDGSVVAWYRPVDGTGDRLWTQIGSSAAISSTAANPGNSILFGQGASTTSYIRVVQYASGAYRGVGFYAQDNWEDLLGRGLVPSGVYVDGGTSIRAVDGPTLRGETWYVDCAYQYGVEQVFPDVSPSPRRTWRSTTDGSDTYITWDLGTNVTYALGGGLLGVYLGGANFPDAVLQGQDFLSAWHDVAAINLRRSASALKWTRKDRVVLPDTSGGGSISYYLPTDILAGDHVLLGTGKVRTVATNSPGTWTASGTSLATKILLTGVDGTEGGSGTAGEIWASEVAVVVPCTTTYKAFRLKIPSVTTQEGYFTLGTLVWGEFVPLGAYTPSYGWGHSRETSWSSLTTETRSGARSVKRLAPSRRSREVSWVDGVDTSNLVASSPDYAVGWTGGNPVAVPVDIPWSVPGLIDRLDGAVTPVVLLDAVTLPATSTTVSHARDRRGLLYGRVVTESLRVDTVLGDELKSELVRVGVVRIEQET